MEAATTAFLITTAIIGGILAPLMVFYILGLIGKALTALGQLLENKAEEIKKLPPYDDVLLNQDPMTNILTAELIRKGKVIYKGSVSRNEIIARDENTPVRFRKDVDK